MTIVTLPDKKKRGKYNVRHDQKGKEARTVDGILFDSAREAKRFWELRQLQNAGQIKGLIFDKNKLRFDLEVNGVHVCSYEADFAYRKAEEPDNLVIEDVKGCKTREYKIKKRLMLAVHGIEIREV